MKKPSALQIWLWDHPIWTCGVGSCDGVLFVKIYGGRETWWKRTFIRPLHRIGCRIHSAKWWLLHRFHPRHRYFMVNTGLTPGYYDWDARILHACMAMLSEYVECNGGKERLAEFSRQIREKPDVNAPEGMCEGRADRQDESIAIYHWWKVEKPADEERRDTLLRKCYGRACNGTKEDLAEMRRLEEKIDADEDKMLHRLIDIRGGLWS